MSPRHHEPVISFTITMQRDGRPALAFTYLPREDAFHVVVYDWRGLVMDAATIGAPHTLELLREAAQNAAARAQLLTATPNEDAP